MFVVQQENEAGGKPFKVQVSGSEITNAVGAVAFLNVGGELSLEDVAVEAADFTALVSTGSSKQGDEGSTFLRGITVVSSTITVRTGC